MVMDTIVSRMRAGHTQLALGPMSVQCVDAVIDAARRLRRPLMLIASRRQIECADYGGGYVHDWSTEAFARYVRQHDPRGLVALCRDHGGPRQHPSEACMSDAGALESAKHSLRVDIAEGFDLVHLDMSGIAAGMEATAEMYAHVQQQARDRGQRVHVEIGMDPQTGALTDSDELRATLDALQRLCARHAWEFPLFVVVQTGTLVVGRWNVGRWSTPLNERAKADLLARTRDLADVVASYGAFIKEHNGDYLSADVLRARPAARIGGINVAPELGVLQTEAFLGVCRLTSCLAEADELLRLAYESGRWRKWFDAVSSASDLDKAIAAGHYIFATRAFRELYVEVAAAARRRGINLDAYVTAMLTDRICDIAANLTGGPAFDAFDVAIGWSEDDAQPCVGDHSGIQ